MKSKYQKQIAIFFMALFPFSVWGAIDNVVMEGMIISYDKKTVTLSQKGRKFKIPRKSISQDIKLKTGKIVQIKVDSEKLMNKIIKLKKKEKKEKQKNKQR